MYMTVLCVYVHQMYVWFLKGPEKSIGFPAAGVLDGCEPPMSAGN